MTEIEFLREQAQRCFAAAKNCFDLAAVRRLEELGNDCQERADNLEQTELQETSGK